MRATCLASVPEISRVESAGRVTKTSPGPAPATEEAIDYAPKAKHAVVGNEEDGRDRGRRGAPGGPRRRRQECARHVERHGGVRFAVLRRRRRGQGMLRCSPPPKKRLRHHAHRAGRAAPRAPRARCACSRAMRRACLTALRVRRGRQYLKKHGESAALLEDPTWVSTKADKGTHLRAWPQRRPLCRPYPVCRAALHVCDAAVWDGSRRRAPGLGSR